MPAAYKIISALYIFMPATYIFMTAAYIFMTAAYIITPAAYKIIPSPLFINKQSSNPQIFKSSHLQIFKSSNHNIITHHYLHLSLSQSPGFWLFALDAHLSSLIANHFFNLHRFLDTPGNCNQGFISEKLFPED